MKSSFRRALNRSSSIRLYLSCSSAFLTPTSALARWCARICVACSYSFRAASTVVFAVCTSRRATSISSRPGASLEHAKSRGLFGDLPFRLSQIGAVVPVDEAGEQVAHAHYIPLIHGDLFDDPGHLGSHVRVAAGEDLELPGGLQLHGEEEEDGQEAH